MNSYRDLRCLEDKRLRALERERNRLWDEEHAMEPVPLAVPYQSGWLRYFVLTDRARKRPDAAALEAILRQINVVVHFRRHPDTIRLRRRRGLDLKWRAEQQTLRWLDLWQLDRLRWSQEWLGYFEQLPRYLNLSSKWRFAKPDLYCFEVVPRIITHVRQISPGIRSRLAEIEHELTPARWGRLSNLHGCRVQWRERARPFDRRRADENYRLQMAELRSEGVIPQAVRPAGLHGLRDHVSHLGPQALKGCSALLTRRAGSITLEVHLFHLFLWRPNPTSVRAWLAKPRVPFKA